MNNFQENIIYKLKPYSEIIASAYNPHNDLGIYYYDGKKVAEEDYKIRTGHLFVYNESHLIEVHINNKIINCPFEFFTIPTQEEVIEQFKSDNSFGIALKDNDNDFDHINSIKKELKLEQNRVKHKTQYPNKLAIYNNNKYSNTKLDLDEFYFIPSDIFTDYYNKYKQNKGIPMLQNFTKEFLLQQDDLYFIKIESQEMQKKIDLLFKNNEIDNNISTIFNSNIYNTFYITNQNTWIDSLPSDAISINGEDWISIIEQDSRKTLTEFKINTLYRIRSFKSLEQEFGVKDKDKINIRPSFTKEMEDDIYLKQFFSINSEGESFKYRTEGTRDWYITPQMCYEVTDIEFFTEFFNTSIDLRFKVENLTDDKLVRELLSSFNRDITTNSVLNSHTLGGYYSLEGSYGSLDLAEKKKYNLINPTILQNYISSFLEKAKILDLPVLDISTLYESSTDDRRIEINKRLDIYDNTLNSSRNNYISLLPDGKFITHNTQIGNGDAYDSITEDDFFERVDSQINISTKHMLSEIFNSNYVQQTIDAPEPIIEQLPLDINGITFAQVVHISDKPQIDISVQTKKQLEELLNLFRDYGIPYKTKPKFKRGLKLSAAKASEYDTILNNKPSITFNSFQKLEEDNRTVYISNSHIEKNIKQFYLKEIEYKYYHNDKEVCKVYMQTQGDVHEEKIAGSVKRYFTAKDLGIAHDGLTEKSQRVMDEIVKELDSPLAIADKEHVMLIGQSGSGKTTIAEHYFENKNQQYVKEQGTSALSRDDILGYISITTHEYKKSLLRLAVENGWGYILDEADGCNPNTLLAYNALKSNTMQFPDEKIEIHPDFRLIFTANTLEFSEKYNARGKFDYATKARFSIVEYNLNLLDLGERYGAKYIKQIEDPLDLDPREIQRKVRHLKEAEMKEAEIEQTLIQNKQQVSVDTNQIA